MKKKLQGLSKEEVLKSRETYGSNEIEKVKKKNIWLKLGDVFKEPMFILLLITASIYFILGSISDGITMLIFVLVISLIEFIQSEKTDRAINSLNDLLMLDVKVIREGKEIKVASNEVVVGDLMVLEEGDRVCADGIIRECYGLGLNEAALTGEQEVVYKRVLQDNKSHFKKNMCYSGSDVVYGKAIVEVTSVGEATEYGKIGAMLKTIKKEKTPLDKQIKKLVVVCSIISLCFFILVVLINFIVHNAMPLKERIIEAILAGITIAMATIPEEIPVVLTVFLAMGSLELAKKNTLTKRPKAVETLGAVSVLCTDKTGTLTENKMLVKDTYELSNSLGMVAKQACLLNSYDPMEIAIKDYFKEDINNLELQKEYVFNDVEKMMGNVWRDEKKQILCVKGAYENVLSLCRVDAKTLDKINKKAKEFSLMGYRVLGVAKRENIRKLREKISDYKLDFVGLIALIDLPRKNVKEAILSCQKAGVKVVMITGDSGDTALGIAKMIGLKVTNVITGKEIEAMDDLELAEKIKKTNIFARVYPKHKMRIVSALQKNGEVVAMTGDGVNDCPALKRAEIGIAMGNRGTNVAKNTADMILVDDNFATIVSAIKNGRKIYANIKKAISYILVIHIPIILIALLTPLFQLPTMLLPVHILLLELIIDPTSSIVFQRLEADKDIMNQGPRGIDELIISAKDVLKCVGMGWIIFLATFLSYFVLLKLGKGILVARTFAFAVLVLSNACLVSILSGNNAFKENLKNNLKDKVTFIINLIILGCLLLLVYTGLNKIVAFHPLSLPLILGVLLVSILVIWFLDILKSNV